MSLTTAYGKMFPVTETLPGELVLRSARMLRRRMSQTLAPFDLQPHQARALSVITGEGDDGLRLGALADLLHVAPRSVTDVVDALAGRGLVARSPDPADRRAVVVRATAAGRAVGAEVTAARRADLAAWAERVPVTDRAELVRILQALLAD